MKDDLRIKAWTDLCAPCLAEFERWRDAPNPGAWANPGVQASPQLLAFLASCRATGPSPEAWRETVSFQLLLIRRHCTADEDGTHGAWTPLPAPGKIIWPGREAP
jgi:hypothetical protein